MFCTYMTTWSSLFMKCSCILTIVFSHAAINNSHMIYDFLPKLYLFEVLHFEILVNIFGAVVTISI